MKLYPGWEDEIISRVRRRNYIPGEKMKLYPGWKDKIISRVRRWNYIPGEKMKLYPRWADEIISRMRRWNYIPGEKMKLYPGWEDVLVRLVSWLYRVNQGASCWSGAIYNFEVGVGGGRMKNKIIWTLCVMFGLPFLNFDSYYNPLPTSTLPVPFPPLPSPPLPILCGPWTQMV